MPGEERPFRIGEWLVQPQLNQLIRARKEIKLEPRVMQVLLCLAESPGEVVSKEMLIQTVWKDSFVTDDVLINAIWGLRKAFGEDAKHPRFIQTIRKKGYRLIAPVSFEKPPTTIGLHRIKWTIPIVGAVAALAAIALWGLWRSQSRPESPRSPVHSQVTFTGKAWVADISPDGQFVVYSVRGTTDEGLDRLIVQDLAGGKPLEIFQADHLCEYRWSPDGTELDVAAEKDQHRDGYLVPRLGGTFRQLGLGGTFRRSGGHPHGFSRSSDGRYYAVAGLQSKEIAIVEKSTGETYFVPLEGSFVSLWDIDWSPTGNFLAFLTWDDKFRHVIWTIPAEGGTQKKVVEGSFIRYPRWSSDGAAIYYLSTAIPGDITSLWKLGIDRQTGEGVAAPTVLLTGDIQSISFSHDESRLVYTKAVEFSNLWHITLSDATPVAKQLTAGTVYDDWPDISPDGHHVAFERHGNIYSMPLEGGSVRQLTFMESFEWSPAWSPDGTWIAFGSGKGGTARVWRVRAQGGLPQPFKRTHLSMHYMVTWAPGSQILYHRPGNRNFHLLDPNTEQETPLIKDDSVGRAYSPVYSPDGKRVAVLWSRTQSGGTIRSLWTISLEDSGEVRVHEGELQPLGWSANGAVIYAQDYRDKSLDIVKFPSTGGQAETFFEWPFKGKTGTCVSGADETQWVCAVRESRSDIWLVENLDPDLK